MDGQDLGLQDSKKCVDSIELAYDKSIVDVSPGFQPRPNPVQLLVDLL